MISRDMLAISLRFDAVSAMRTARPPTHCRYDARDFAGAADAIYMMPITATDAAHSRLTDRAPFARISENCVSPPPRAATTAMLRRIFSNYGASLINTVTSLAGEGHYTHIASLLSMQRAMIADIRRLYFGHDDALSVSRLDGWYRATLYFGAS